APRGLSTEEKRVKLVQILHETKDFFQLKELEKLGPKMTGIVSQSIKEVVQSLVDDGLVQYNKIGSPNCTFSAVSRFGGGACLSIRRTVHIDHPFCGRVGTKQAQCGGLDWTTRRAERDSALEKLSGLKRNLTGMEEKLENYGARDPVKTQEKERAVVLAKEAEIRWTGDLLTPDDRQLLMPQGPCPSDQSSHRLGPSRSPGDRR
ncbi:hypothetical protein BDM02DRAFT_3098387, partial [Thelephora ganbajun]